MYLGDCFVDNAVEMCTCTVGHISRNEASVPGHVSFKVSLNSLYMDNFTDILREYSSPLRYCAMSLGL